MRYTLRWTDLYPWGDYGSILAHGMTRLDESGVLHAVRTGPFVPRFSFPTLHVIVDDFVKTAFESSNLSGFLFRPVEKSHIVRLDWHLWDRRATTPLHYPKGGEPENYILDQKHCQKTAKEMTGLWELTGTPFGSVSRENGVARWIASNEPVLDFIRPNDPNWNVLSVSSVAKEFIETIHDGTVKFNEYRKLEIIGDAT